MPSENNLALDMMMSQVTHQSYIKGNDSNKDTILSKVFYDRIETTCILRVCKGRDLSAICEVLKNIRNPYLTMVYDYVYANGDTYILEEYLEGTCIEDIIEQEGVFSEKKTAEIVIDICKGLSEMHQQKPPVIHNDIKPLNIMILQDNRVKVFDFDISRTYKKGAKQNTEIILTEDYASPEQYGYGQTTPASDVYSLGVTMHKMLTGNVLSNQRQTTYKGSLKKIIQKCIHQLPDKRYPNADALKKTLEKYLQRRKRILWYFLGILCLVAVLVVGIVFALDSSSKSNSNDIQSPGISSDSTTNAFNDISNTQGNNENTTTKKMTTARNNVGNITSMVALKDNTVVYIEESEGQRHLKSSTNIDVVLSTDIINPQLIYNPFKSTLYIVGLTTSGAALYEVDSSFTIGATPVYNAIDSGKSYGFTGIFFSDGVLYCDAFNDNLIDSNKWCSLGEISTKPDAIIGDKIYKFDILKQNLDEINTNGDMINYYAVPGQTKSTFFDGNSLYIAVEINEKNYIYEFNGLEFLEVVCLDDYLYYSDWNYNSFCVTQDKVWLYNGSSEIINEIPLK